MNGYVRFTRDKVRGALTCKGIDPSGGILLLATEHSSHSLENDTEKNYMDTAMYLLIAAVS